MIRKGFIFSFILFISILFLAACSSDTSAPEKAEPKDDTEKTEDVVIQHAMGETKVHPSPKRVVILDNGGLDNVLALGVKPVGAPTIVLDMPFPEYLGSQTDGIQNIGSVNEPNLETITQLQPDLILGSKDTHEALYDQLSLIAPTVFVETVGTTWRENLLLQGKALGIEDKAKELLDNYNKRVTDYKNKVNGSEIEVSVIRARTDKVSVYLKQSFAGSILEELGLARPESQRADDFAMDLNNEAIPELDGDYLIWFTRDVPNIIDTNFSTNPMWQNLEAVKNEKVYEVSFETWLSGLGVQAANFLIDDVEKYIK